ncbi:MAG: thiosulfate oxidation carrier protein SoxY [Betaproteobacteria bacterium RIFCSPLOWO2_12_FULL_65_14]|nr:MAG: thiosulfate oxidation carrier protein SoxY [Betaproteobacteria bacterium RIFCSPLOWO2_12_FULL_65_14]
MNDRRRNLLSSAGAAAALLALGLLKPVLALAATWNKDAFASKNPGDALKSIGAANPAPSGDIVIEAPQIAENGAVVPIEITSKIAGTTSLAVLVEKNPYPLVAKFDFMEGALPFVKINAKMGETSDVRVVATAGGKHYVATKEIKVTIGGCGG